MTGSAEHTDSGSRTPRLRLAAGALRTYSLLIAIAVVWIVFGYVTDGIFLESRNLSNLTRQAAVTGLLAVGMVMVIVAGHIDLSVGSLVGLTGAVAAIVQTSHEAGLVLSLAAALGVGLLAGIVHGALVAYGNIPAFIVTLGGLLAWRGVVKAATQGSTIPLSIPGFRAIGQEYLPAALAWLLVALAVGAILWGVRRSNRARREHGLPVPGTASTAARMAVPSVLILLAVSVLNSYAGVPLPVLLFVAVALVTAVAMQNTVFGRYVYAIGGNREAARLSGVNIRRHVLAVFALMGLLAGVAGIVYTARVGSASPDAGLLLELDAIAACVIGGASLMGGRGSVLGACLGALLMASLDNGMSLKNISDYMQDIVKGVILVAAVGADMFARRRG